MEGKTPQIIINGKEVDIYKPNSATIRTRGVLTESFLELLRKENKLYSPIELSKRFNVPVGTICSALATRYGEVLNRKTYQVKDKFITKSEPKPVISFKGKGRFKATNVISELLAKKDKYLSKIRAIDEAIKVIQGLR